MRKIKFLGAIFIIFSGWMLGLTEFNNLQYKCKYISGLIEGLEYIKSEMTFSKPIMSDLLKKSAEFAGEAKKVFLNLSDEIADNHTTIGKAFEANEQIVREKTNDEVCNLFKDIMAQMGSTDISTQIEIIDNGIYKLKLLLNKSTKKCEKEGLLYKRIGVVVGIGVSVLLL